MFIDRDEFLDELICTEYNAGDYDKAGWTFDKIVEVLNRCPIYNCVPAGYDAYLWWNEDLQKWTIEPEDLNKLLGRG